MKPIYKELHYFIIKFVYKTMPSGEISESDPVKVYNENDIQNIIDAELERILSLRDKRTIYVTDIKITSSKDVMDKSIIQGWEDVRPGDYCVHINSLNNIESNIELGFDFYVAKLTRDQEIVVEKYYMRWLAYQGAYVITKYMDDSRDAFVDVDVVYDQRLFPTLNDQERLLGRRWAYSKVAKFASMYAVEEPDVIDLPAVEV